LVIVGISEGFVTVLTLLDGGHVRVRHQIVLKVQLRISVPLNFVKKMKSIYFHTAKMAAKDKVRLIFNL
jgi:hypothetical protein